MIIVPIKGSKASIEIEILGYERPDASDVSDANWLICNVQLKIIQFQGFYEAAFTTTDFLNLKAGLEKALSNLCGSASFISDEEALSFDIKIDSNGTATIAGTAKVHGLPKLNFSFTFETDQSFLQETQNALIKVCKSFPVKP
jgi:hypothetical protein